MTDPVFAGLFWGLMFLSAMIARWGVWRRSKSVLLLSSLLSVPYCFLLALYPATRIFLFVPALHLLAWAAIGRFTGWSKWLLLLPIVLPIAWFISQYSYLLL